MTAAEAYQTSVQYLQLKAGLEQQEAKTKARLLVDHVTGIRYAHLIQPTTELDVNAIASWHQALAEVAEGRPLPYLLQEWEFFGLRFSCDERALIPRPETETLVEAALQRLKELGTPLGAPRVADLGTGTGCIAISVAHALPHAQVYATDLATGALELARTNAARHHVKDRVHFITGLADSWTTPLVAAGCTHKLDAVLSNPPYIATNEIATLQPETSKWEPRAALDGGADGLDCYRQIALQCDILLAPQGFLMVELGAGQYEAVREIFVTAGWFVEPPIYDLIGLKRVLAAHRE